MSGGSGAIQTCNQRTNQHHRQGRSSERGSLICRVVSGPMAAVMLADQGAEVIKVEPPGWGDGVRYLGASRGGCERDILADQSQQEVARFESKASDGQAILMRLLATADGVMHNYRPGKMERLGLGYARLREHFPISSTSPSVEWVMLGLGRRSTTM